MVISILTLFPHMFDGPFQYSILKKAQEKGILTLSFYNIRDWAKDAYKSVDDRPYGGGEGMILRVDVLHACICDILKNAKIERKKTCIVLMDPKGVPYAQTIAAKLSHYDHLIVISGHYEGVDHRIRSFIDMQISIGDYILTGGEIPSMVIVDSVVRLLPGVLKSIQSIRNESFSKPNILEYPQYTRPQVYLGKRVPHVLLNGNHSEINVWRIKHSDKRTNQK